jgi:hypothetical protein
MDTHIKVAAWLRIIGSAMYLFLALVVLVIYGGIAILVGGSGGSEAAAAEPVLKVVVVCLSMLFGVLALPGLLTGWGLLNYRPWARIVNIVLSIFDLLHVPVGTAIGAYSLWVMFHPETAELFEARVSPGRYPTHF